MKIVKNKCYGGFGLSSKALKMYVGLKGFKIFFYEQIEHEFDQGKDKFQRTENSFFNYIITKDLGDTSENLPNELIFLESNIARDDKDLVKVVETLGKEASSSFAQLEIVDIPDDVDWEIDEYDGFEKVVEKYRSW